MNAAVTPISPAYHSELKSVKANGKIKAPREATGRSSMHFFILLGSFARKGMKYGMIRGIIVKTEHTRIMVIDFIDQPPHRYI